MTKPGNALPSRISAGRKGVTSSWSNVPCSRSRATDSAVTSVVTTSVSSPTMPGTMNQRLNRFGLNHARVSSRACAPGPPVCRSQSALNAARMVLT